MIFGFKSEYLGKKVMAYIPKKDGELEFREGIIDSFVNAGQDQADPYYLIKYDNIELPHAANPEWLVFAK
jgi:hypothetical protein